MTSAIGNAKGVDLNTASAEELDRVGGLGHDRVQRIIENRPFQSWEDLKRVEGFSDTLVNDLKNAGATLAACVRNCAFALAVLQTFEQR